MRKRKNGILAKLTALCLTLLMAVGSFGGTAFAAIEENTGSISISGVESGVTVTAYKIITANYDYAVQQPTDPEYTWDVAIAAYVAAEYPSYINTDDNSVTDSFTGLTADESENFFDYLASCIEGNSLQLTTKTATADTNGKATLSGLGMGSYLILFEGGMKIYRPSVVNVTPTWSESNKSWTMTTTELEVKSDEPTIEKKIVVGTDRLDEDSVAIGDTVTFELTVPVPTYPSNAIAKTFNISDDLSDGLTLTTGTIKVTVDGTNLYTTDNKYYTLTTGGTLLSESTSVDFTVAFTSAFLEEYAGKKVVVTYDATVNKDAVIGAAGNPNTAYLEYNNNPYDSSSYKVKDDEVKVYSYGIKVYKVDGSKKALTGAEFELAEKTTTGSTTTLSFVKTADGVYRMATAEDDASTTTTTLVVNSTTGLLTLNGLDEGEYKLKETKAPDGYNLPSTSKTITITDADSEGKLDGIVNGSTDGYVSETVINTTGFVLPSTGGIGTIVFTAAGIAIMGAALILFFVLRRRNAVR